MFKPCLMPDNLKTPMDLLTNENWEIIEQQEIITRLKNYIEIILKNYRPVMGGEIYLSGEEVCQLLHISKRTLQQYRDDNIVPFIQIEGKIIYKESDILLILERNYNGNKTCRL